MTQEVQHLKEKLKELEKLAQRRGIAGLFKF